MGREGELRKLNGIHKDFVLRCLACGFQLQEVVDCVKDEFDIEVTRQNIHYYLKTYPDKVEALRHVLAENIEQIPFAKKLTRVAYLDRMAKRQWRRRQYGEVRATLKQIAEEVGGLVQKHELTGANGGPIETRTEQLPMDLSRYTEDELAAMRSIHEAANARRDQEGAGEPTSE